ncbi:MAG: RecX family transcriptional regulator [Bacilli bacterium]
MKVIDIKVGKVKVTISFDEHPDIVLPVDIFYENYLVVEDEISLDKIEQLTKISSYANLQRYAYNLFARKAYTEAQITEKLTIKGATKADIEKIIKRLRASYLIDDRRYLTDYFHLAKERGYGKHKIIKKLIEVGIPNYLLQQLKFDDVDELQRATSQLAKLLNKYRNVNSRKQKEKVYRALIESGYDHEIVAQVVENANFRSPERDFVLLQQDYEKALRHYVKLNDNYEKKAKITRYLLQRGYNYNDILKVLEAHNDKD